MGEQKKEFITKLEKISALYKNTVKIQAEMDGFVPEDHYQRKVDVPDFPLEVHNAFDTKVLDVLKNDLDHTADNAIEAMGRCYDEAYHPQKPNEPVKPTYKGADTGKSREKQRKLRLISNIGLGVAIFFLLGAIVGTSDTPEALPAILIIALVGAGAFVGGRFLGKKEKEVEDKLEAEARAVYDGQIAELDKQHKQKIKAYEDECAAYASVRQAFLKEYAQWRNTYLESLAEEEKISEQLEDDRMAAVNKIHDEAYIPAEAALNQCNDLVSADYLPVLDIIIDLLRSNRADDLKEAINLYEDIVYRERQLELEREKEEQRRWEEEQRRRDEERHHKEQMRFQQDQERQRRREEERRQQDAERRHREEMDQRDRQERDRQNEERRRADEERRRTERAELDRKQKEDQDTRHQCNACAQVGHCSMAFRRPNCASFRPR